jgi:hypothetical protein
MTTTMLYRAGSEIEYQGARLDTLIVGDSEVKAALADGWSHLADLYDAEGAFIGQEAPQPEGIQGLTAAQIIAGIPEMSLNDLGSLKANEQAREKPRKGVLAAIEAAEAALKA